MSWSDEIKLVNDQDDQALEWSKIQMDVYRTMMANKENFTEDHFEQIKLLILNTFQEEWRTGIGDFKFTESTLQIWATDGRTAIL